MPHDSERQDQHANAAATGGRRGRGRSADTVARAPEHAAAATAPPDGSQAAGIEPLPPSGLPADFIETIYLALNPDVDDAVTRGVWQSGAAHWMAKGWSETRPTLSHPPGLAAGPPENWRRPGPETERFDAPGYLSLYPDLTSALGADLVAARAHWVSFGRQEGRIGPGAEPYIQRRPSLDAVLALPFGLDIYGPFAEIGPRGQQARQLVRDLLAAGIPTRARAFAIVPAGPRIAAAEQRRRPVHRVSLILAEPTELATLHCLYPPDHFASSYVIAAWSTEPDAFQPEWFSVFGAIDELWVADLEAEAGYRASAPVAVQSAALPVPSIRLGPTGEAPGPIVVLCSGTGDTAARLAALAVEAAVAAVARLGRAAPSFLFAVPQASQDPALVAVIEGSLAQAGSASTGRAPRIRASVITDPLSPTTIARLAQDARLLLTLSDGPDSLVAGCAFAEAGRAVVALAGSPLARRLGDRVQPVATCLELSRQPALLVPHRLPRRVPDPAALAAALRHALDRPLDVGPVRLHPPAVLAMRRRLEALGLDVRVPPFATDLGRSSTIRVPTIAAGLSQQDWPRLAALGSRVSFCLLLTVGEADAPTVRRCVTHVQAQLYPFWTLSLVDDRRAIGDVRRLIEALRGSHPQLRIETVPPGLEVAVQLNLVAERSTDTHLLLLRPQDLLEPDALMELAAGLDLEPPPALLYADSAASGADAPAVRRPAFSPDRLRSEAYIGQLLVVERSAWQHAGGLTAGYGSAAGYDLALRLMEAAAPIAHVCRPVSRRLDAAPDPASELRALQAHAGRTGGRIEPGREPGFHRYRPAARPHHPVSIVIIEAGGGHGTPPGGTLALVRSLRRQVPPADGEILLIHGAGALSRSDIPALQAHAVRLEAAPTAISNRAALRMLGVTRATHPLLLFMDPGIVPKSDLVEALLEAADDPAVAAVGVRLTPSLERDDRPSGIANVSAVSGACLLVRRDGARIVRGFDESLTTETACDVDFCFRLRSAGFRVVYTPYADAGPTPAARPIEDAAVQGELRAIWIEPTLQVIDGNQMPARHAMPIVATPVGSPPVPVADAV